VAKDKISCGNNSVEKKKIKQLTKELGRIGGAKKPRSSGMISIWNGPNRQSVK